MCSMVPHARSGGRPANGYQGLIPRPGGRGVGVWGSRVEVGGAYSRRRPKGATMLADLDLLLTAVFCTADDLLPEKAKNAKRSVTDAEVVTLAVAQQVMAWTMTLSSSRLPPSGCGICPRGCQGSRATGAPPPLDRDDRVADRRLRPGLSGLPRPGRALSGLPRPGRAAGLDAGRVRPLGRNRTPPPARRRLRLQPQPQPLVLGHAPAPPRRPRRHPEGRDPPPPPRRPQRTRCRTQAAPARAARRRSDRRRQVLRRQGIRRHGR